jgi:hypothetical protein
MDRWSALLALCSLCALWALCVAMLTLPTGSLG